MNVFYKKIKVTRVEQDGIIYGQIRIKSKELTDKINNEVIININDLED